MSALLMAASLALAAPKKNAEPLVWNTSYVAQGLRPGFKIGLDYPLAESRKVRDSRRPGKKTVRRALVVEPSVMAWHHWGNHTPITAGAQLIYRKGFGNGRHRELFVGQGATYAINAGRTYSFDDSGELQGSALAGNLMSATSVGFGLGRDLSRRKKGGPDLTWYVRPTATIWAPYNSGVAPVLTIELGVRRAWSQR